MDFLTELLKNEHAMHFLLGVAGAFCFQVWQHISNAKDALPILKSLLYIFAAGIVTLVFGTSFGHLIGLFLVGVGWPKFLSLSTDVQKIVLKHIQSLPTDGGA